MRRLNKEQAPAHATRESLYGAMKTHHSQNNFFLSDWGAVWERGKHNVRASCLEEQTPFNLSEYLSCSSQPWAAACAEGHHATAPWDLTSSSLYGKLALGLESCVHNSQVPQKLPLTSLSDEDIYVKSHTSQGQGVGERGFLIPQAILK